MRTFAEYVQEMNDVNHDKDWHDKYKDKTLTLKAIFKKLKIKKNKTVIECRVDGENVIVYMLPGYTDKAQKMSYGDTFYVRGKVAKKRWGIFHTMGLNEGELVED